MMENVEQDFYEEDESGEAIAAIFEAGDKGVMGRPSQGGQILPGPGFVMIPAQPIAVENEQELIQA